MEIISFHTHTERCRHAAGSVRDYLSAAHCAGIRTIGISDHAPIPADSSDSRMPFAHLAEYMAEVRSSAREFPDMEVLLGAEVERFPGFGLEEIRRIYVDEHAFDYRLGAVHPFPAQGESIDSPEGVLAMVRRMVRENIEMIESGMFVCMAHPDIFGCISDVWLPEYSVWSRQLISAALECGVFLEFNAYGLRKPKKQTSAGLRWQYPQLPFWEIAAEMKAPAVIGMDAHTPADTFSNWEEAASLLAAFGIRPANAEMLDVIRKRGTR